MPAKASNLPLAFGLALAAAVVIERGLANFAQAFTGGGSGGGDGGTSLPVNMGKVAAGNTKAVGIGRFDGQRVALWILPILKYARAHGWKGTVTSGYRSFADQTRIYNSGVRPAAVPGTSNHEGDAFPRGAVDVTDASQLSAILLKSPFRRLLVWAGSQDPVHFSHPHGGSY